MYSVLLNEKNLYSIVRTYICLHNYTFRYMQLCLEVILYEDPEVGSEKWLRRGATPPPPLTGVKKTTRYLTTPFLIYTSDSPGKHFWFITQPSQLHISLKLF